MTSLEPIAALDDVPPCFLDRCRQQPRQGFDVHRQSAVRNRRLAAKARALDQVFECRQRVESLAPEGDADPLVHEGVALSVRHEARNHEHGLVRREWRHAGQHRRFVAAERSEHPIVQPGDYGVQAPEVVLPRPSRLVTAALGNGVVSCDGGPR